MLVVRLKHPRNNQRSLHLLMTAALTALVLSACGLSGKPPVLTPEFLVQNPSLTSNPAQLKTSLAAAFTPTPNPSPTPWPVSSATPTSLPPSAPDLNPLTGLTVTDPNLLSQRPILVKIANWPQELRPANGLLQADIVFETYMGHQMNHFTALYFGSDGRSVGPLAPARLSDTRVTEHFQANIAFASADPQVENIFNSDLPDRFFIRGYTPCPAMCTESKMLGGNTVVTTSALREYIASQAQPSFIPSLNPLTFSPEVDKWDEEAARFTSMYADFSVMDWRYNQTTRQYDLWQDFQAKDGMISLVQSVDRDTKTPLSWDNVLFLFTDYIEYSDSFYDIDMRSGDPNQQALLLRNGKLIHATWQSNANDQSFTFFTLDGKPLPLRPGRTWITFTGLNSKIKQVQEGVWELTFSIK